jgi:hypothetical protein
MNPIDLIGGVPACGKTTFGDYLRDKKGYLHVDMESFQDSWHHRIWEAARRADDLTLFVELLAREGRPVVLTWGFHPSDLDIVKALRALDVFIWWFDADEAAARTNYIARGTGEIAAFDAQIQRIKKSWSAIHPIVSPRIIRTLDESGIHKQHGEIWTEMKSKR